MEKVFWGCVGAVIMYYWLNSSGRQSKNIQVLDELRNTVHGLIKKYAPDADDVAVGNDVIANIK